MVNYDSTNSQHHEALSLTAKFYEENAQDIFNEDLYADHVTQSEKLQYLQNGLKYAEEVYQGQHLECFAVLQRFNSNLTGECEPLLPLYNEVSHNVT